MKINSKKSQLGACNVILFIEILIGNKLLYSLVFRDTMVIEGRFFYYLIIIGTYHLVRTLF